MFTKLHDRCIPNDGVHVSPMEFQLKEASACVCVNDFLSDSGTATD